MKKICKRCNKEKDCSEFHKNNSFKSGLNNTCKVCVCKRNIQRYNENKEKYRKSARELYTKNREKYLENNRKRELAIKDRVFMHYGGYVCNCCGETIKQFLTIDHIYGGGTKDRKEAKGGGRYMYRKIIKDNFPPLFQVLCFNCNSGRALNKGICPHKENQINQN